jgi:hypothetical protein
MSEIRKAVLRFTRRSIGKALLAALTLGVLPQAVEAFRPHLFGGGVAGSGPPPGTITTFTLLGTQTSGVPTQTFGMPFVDGDMPAGSAPVFKIGGSAQPYSYGLRAYFPSGNLRFVSIMLLPNVSISGSATVSVSSAVGSWPAVSGRSPTDVYNQQLVVNAPPLALADPGGVANGALPGGGLQVSAWLRSDANNYKQVQWMDGAAGAAWRVSTNMAPTIGGTADTFLKFDHYIFALNNSSGGLAGFRWMGRMRMPNYAVTTSGNNNFFCAPPNSGSPTSGLNWQINPGGAGVQTIVPTWPFTPVTDMTAEVAFTGTATLSNGSGGSGSILDVTSVTSGSISNGTQQGVTGANVALEEGSFFEPYGTGGTTGTGGVGTYALGNTPGGLITSPINVFTPGTLNTTTGSTAWSSSPNDNFVPVQFSGSVPAPWSAGYVYWGHINVSAPPANFQACNTTFVSPNSVQPPQAPATFTATPVFGFCPFTSAMFATSGALYNFFQGTGSQSAETTLRATINKVYWQSCRFTAPYDTTLSGAEITDTTYNYNWNCYSAGSIGAGISSGGDNAWIGVLTNYAAVDFYNQSQASDTQNRIVGLAASMMCYDLKDPALDTIVNVSNNSYTGLPTSNTAICSGGNGGTPTGYTQPGPGSAGALFFQAADASHVPFFSFWPYIRTGELQYYDLLVEQGMGAELLYLGAGARNPSSANGDSPYSGTTYGVVTYNIQEARGTGWGFRNLAAAALIGPWNPTDPTYLWDGTQQVKYLNDLADVSATFTIDQWNMNPSGVFTPYAAGASMWTQYQYNANSGSPGFNASPMWENCYIALGHCYSYLRGTASAAKSLDFINLMIARFNYIISTYGGGYSLYAYTQQMTIADVIGGGNVGTTLNTSDAQYVISQISAFNGNTTVLLWQTGSTNAFYFTASGPSQGWTPANGDVLIPYEGNGSQNYPTELNPATPYYIVNYNPSPGDGHFSEFGLATTRGGSAIPISSPLTTGSANFNYMPGPTNQPAADVPYAPNFMFQVRALMAWGNALGASGAATPLADAAFRLNNNNQGFGPGLYFSEPGGDNPIDGRYCIASTYT